MQIFLASLATETNTFSPIPAGRSAFESGLLARGGVNSDEMPTFSGPIKAWRRTARDDGHSVIESLVAGAHPAGRVVQSVYEGYRDEILADLARSTPIDIVLLSLHGAMIAENCDDCEGDLIDRAREIVGESTVIACLLDPHCVLTERMVSGANLLIIYKEWPHNDYLERATELYNLATKTASGSIKPVTTMIDCRMLANYPTLPQPMRGFVDYMKEVERNGAALSVSFAHSFIWADVPEMGAKVLVVTDNAPQEGEELARRLKQRIWQIRDQIGPPFLDIDAALDYDKHYAGRPIVLADGADGAGGGAPSDATFVLRRLLERGMSEAVTGCYWDPIAVLMCHEAGESATIGLRVGGKMGPTSGVPVDLKVRINRVIDHAYQSTFHGIRENLGRAAWVSANGVDIVLISNRVATFSTNAFTQFGIDLLQKRVIVVKSAMHFYDSFLPIASQVLFLVGPGTQPMNASKIPYRNLKGRYWPLVDDPFDDLSK